MTSLLNPLLSYLLLYRYVALGLLAYMGAVGAPLPVNVALLALGAFASQGYFNFWGSLAIAATANTLGDLTGYAVMWKWGERIVGLFRLRRARFFLNLERELRSDAAITVFITRFGGSLSSVANLLAGLAKVPFTTFFVNDLAGNIIEPFAWLAVGYAVGNYWSDFSNLTDIVGAIGAVVAILFILIRMERRFTRKYEGK